MYRVKYIDPIKQWYIPGCIGLNRNNGYMVQLVSIRTPPPPPLIREFDSPPESSRTPKYSNTKQQS